MSSLSIRQSGFNDFNRGLKSPILEDLPAAVIIAPVLNWTASLHAFSKHAVWVTAVWAVQAQAAIAQTCQPLGGNNYISQ